MTTDQKTGQAWAIKVLVSAAGAAPPAMLSVTLARHPVSMRHPATAVVTA